MAVPQGDAWIEQIFKGYRYPPKAVATGGILRRKIESVMRYASAEELQRAVERRGYHLLVVGDQFVIICNDGDFKVIC